MTIGRASTIEDVARMANVSRQTVSRVINSHPSVKPAVRLRIEEAIAALGYVPNLSARRMGGSRSFMILAINDRQRTLENWSAGRGNDWVDQMLYGGMTACEAHGYHMLFELVDTETALAQQQLARALSSLRPDGVILTPPHSDNKALIALLDDQNTRWARIGPSDGAAGITVSMDEAGAAAEITNHLIDMGHRRIALLTGNGEYGTSRDRLNGYSRAMVRCGNAKPADLIVRGDFLFDRAAVVATQLLERPDRPTAIIAENDEMAFAVMHTANRLGLKIPKTLSLVSFEDTPGVRFSLPPLTAIRQPTAKMIAMACEKLIAASRGEDIRGQFVLPYELVIRQTTGPCMSA